MKKSKPGSSKTSTQLNNVPEYVEFSDGKRLKVHHHLQFSITEEGVFSCGAFDAALMGEAIAAVMKEYDSVRHAVVVAIAKDMESVLGLGDSALDTPKEDATEKTLFAPFRKAGSIPEA